MPNINNKECTHQEAHRKDDYLFGDYTMEGGVTNGYAENLQYTISEKDNEELIKRCNNVLERLVAYGNRNNICINKGKNTLQNIHLD